ncbi:uncharacterized protein BP01DRAFT_384139 [Aspergillus saccharolyticus JOP 1030-1]|uniref:Apple domain-containing protein n=1 Tax=Aspergillus saccharolyticus JOP 1030-1 TaxID=1450539 RepID=A0A318Z900_9EURO|nr:hypothetical protein BP01DRAFT_384139 [Aspergillus saccharolyticus JOP 1030-1]PYH43756.1 hypothetical protein BP01DRAFT_384139 [Aspergillus saccharolyticus JOP 1030-1]
MKSMKSGLLLISALAPASLAATIALPAASAAAESLATITSTYPTVVTSVIASTSAVVTTNVVCATGTASLGSGNSCSDYAWSSAGYYYREMCDGSSISGATTRAAMNVYSRQANINGCEVYCRIFNGMCNAVNYYPALSSCQYLWATGASVVSASGYQAISSYPTNPCTETGTTVETDYLTDSFGASRSSAAASSLFSQQLSSLTPLIQSSSTPIVQQPSTASSPPVRVSSSVPPVQSSASAASLPPSSRSAQPSLIPSAGSSSAVTVTSAPHTTEPPVPGEVDDDVVTSTVQATVTVTVLGSCAIE